MCFNVFKQRILLYKVYKIYSQYETTTKSKCVLLNSSLSRELSHCHDVDTMGTPLSVTSV